MIKSSLQKTTPVKTNHPRTKSALITSKNNPSTHANKSLDLLVDGIDPLIDHENVYDLLGLKSTANLNDSNASFLTDLDGLENEQSLIDDLLYGGTDHHHHDQKRNSTSTSTKNKKHSHAKPPIGRSRSPSLTRASGSSTRPRSRARSRSFTRSSDSDTASRISGDMHYSDVDDSGNGKVYFWTKIIT